MKFEGSVNKMLNGIDNFDTKIELVIDCRIQIEFIWTQIRTFTSRFLFKSNLKNSTKAC